jgi:hypothetical protein
MGRFIDARIPLIFGDAAQADAEDVLLVEGEAPVEAAVARFEAVHAASHAVGCACCTPRSGAAKALSRLLLARARGEIPFFRKVIAVAGTEPGRQAVLDALETDQIVSGCFRLQLD